MITNGNRISANNLPNMSATITSWFQDISFGIVRKTLVDFEEQITIIKIQTRGVVQPPKPETIEILSGGVRNWEWLEVHCLPNFKVNINEYIFYNDIKYKVMQKEDWTQYGYIHYFIQQAFED